jgi:hypothetical protein
VDIAILGASVFEHKSAYTPVNMEAYGRETNSIVQRFLHNQLPFDACIYSLDAALVRFIARMKPEQLDELRAVMLANNERVMDEMTRRGELAARADSHV